MKKRVALIVETSSSYGRDLLAGIVRFMRVRDDWTVFLEERDLWKAPPKWLADWQGDGIISRATTPGLLKAIAKTKVPFVEITDRHGQSSYSQVRSDDVAIGTVGADHLLERGFTRFGFCGYEQEAWSGRREEGFAAAIQERTGFECHRFNSVWHGQHARPWEEEQQALSEWMGSIEPPFAVMAANDVRGRQVVEVCGRLGLSVPEQVAIVGVDNDELLCRVCTPPLSSVIPNASRVGYRAAETLSTLMAGECPEPTLELVAPLGVATRQSTDVVAIEDRRVARALNYIRENACRGLKVAEVVNHSRVSRSTLERQLRKYLGRSPQEEIRSVQIKRAKELLLTTSLPVEQIAAHCGFEHPEYLHVVFKRITGQTTGQFLSRERVSPPESG